MTVSHVCCVPVLQKMRLVCEGPEQSRGDGRTKTSQNVLRKDARAKKSSLKDFNYFLQTSSLLNLTVSFHICIPSLSSTDFKCNVLNPQLNFLLLHAPVPLNFDPRSPCYRVSTDVNDSTGVRKLVHVDSRLLKP